MSLNDPSLLTTLKAQIQIGGIPQVQVFQATFNYHLAHRVQKHSLDIMVLRQKNSQEIINSSTTPTWVGSSKKRFLPKKSKKQ
ncbi:hypothetical protein R6Q57_004343 [Mikania cordata]